MEISLFRFPTPEGVSGVIAITKSVVCSNKRGSIHRVLELSWSGFSSLLESRHNKFWQYRRLGNFTKSKWKWCSCAIRPRITTNSCSSVYMNWITRFASVSKSWLAEMENRICAIFKSACTRVHCISIVCEGLYFCLLHVSWMFKIRQSTIYCVIFSNSISALNFWTQNCLFLRARAVVNTSYEKNSALQNSVFYHTALFTFNYWCGNITEPVREYFARILGISRRTSCILFS